MLGPFATASRRYIAIHQVSLLSHASYSYSAGGVRCPRRHRQRQRQRVTEGTAMAPWNGPNHGSGRQLIYIGYVCNIAYTDIFSAGLFCFYDYIVAFHTLRSSSRTRRKLRLLSEKKRFTKSLAKRVHRGVTRLVKLTDL